MELQDRTRTIESIHVEKALLDSVEENFKRNFRLAKREDTLNFIYRRI